MRLQAVRAPDTPHAGFADAHRPSHGARRPVRPVRGLLLRGLLDDGQHRLRRDRRRAPRPGSIALQPSRTLLEKSRPPASCRAWHHAQPFGNLQVRIAIRGQKYDPAPKHQPSLFAPPR